MKVLPSSSPFRAPFSRQAPRSTAALLTPSGQAQMCLQSPPFRELRTHFSSPNFGATRGTNLPRFVHLGAKVTF